MIGVLLSILVLIMVMVACIAALAIGIAILQIPFVITNFVHDRIILAKQNKLIKEYRQFTLENQAPYAFMDKQTKNRLLDGAWLSVPL